MTAAIHAPQLSYIASDMPEGMRAIQWRAMQARPSRRRRFAARRVLRPIGAIDLASIDARRPL